MIRAGSLSGLADLTDQDVRNIAMGIFQAAKAQEGEVLSGIEVTVPVQLPCLAFDDMGNVVPTEDPARFRWNGTALEIDAPVRHPLGKRLIEAFVALGIPRSVGQVNPV